MLSTIRLMLPLLMLAGACGDGASSLSTEPSTWSAYDPTSTIAVGGVQKIQDRLNAAWTAKDATAYAAPFAADANIISSAGTVLDGRPAIEARHIVLFTGPLALSTQIVTFQRVLMLSETLAIVDGNAVLTNGTTITRSLVRWVMAKNAGVWSIESQQSTTQP